MLRFHEIILDPYRHQDWPKGTLHASYAHVAYMGSGKLNPADVTTKALDKAVTVAHSGVISGQAPTV